MNLYRFKTPGLVPPGEDFFYRCEETSTMLKEDNMPALIRLVQRHCKANSLKCPENLEAIIQHKMCLELPPGFCVGNSTEKIKFHTTTTKIRDYTKIMINRFKMNKDRFFVLQQEAERRARICLSCEEHAQGHCTTCNGLRWITKPMMVGKETPYDKKLSICRICGCILSAKIWVSQEALAACYEKEYPKNCWNHKEKD